MRDKIFIGLRSATSELTVAFTSGRLSIFSNASFYDREATAYGGQTQGLVYDDAVRMAPVVYGSGPETDFGHDAWDGPTTMVEGFSTTTWAYNDADRM